MPGWFDFFVNQFGEEARRRADSLTEEFLRLLKMGGAFWIKTSDGRLFQATGEYRQIRPGELHFCNGRLYKAPEQFFPGVWIHVCYPIVEIPAPGQRGEWYPPPHEHRHQAPPRPRPPDPDKDLRRALKVLGFKREEHPQPAEVKNRYKQLAKRHHPDVNPAGADRMAKINTAMDTYTDIMKMRGTQV